MKENILKQNNIIKQRKYSFVKILVVLEMSLAAKTQPTKGQMIIMKII
jgi:hypothetical protein